VIDKKLKLADETVYLLRLAIREAVQNA